MQDLIAFIKRAWFVVVIVLMLAVFFLVVNFSA